MQQASPEPSLAHRPDLQGLRAVAILLVVLAHAGLPFVPGGFIGVDVFFVLSGYLITGLLVRELAQNGSVALARFYARRLKRLLPALAVMLCATYGAASWLLSGVEARTQLASAPVAATWTSNLYFAFASVGYFDELASRDLYLHTWSLGLEEQFYLVWPVLLLVLFRHGSSRRRASRRVAGLLLPGLGIAFLVSLAASTYWTFAHPQAAFYLMPSRIWQFALGAMVHLAAEGGPVRADADRAWAWPMLAAGLGLILGGAVGLHPKLPYPGAWALVPSLGAALVIAAGHGLRAGRGGPLAHPVLVWLGDRSYSLYLWHWPVFGVGFSLGLRDQALLSLGLILLSLLAAIVSYRVVEHPFWKGRLSHAGPGRVLLVGLLAIVSVLLVLTHSLRQLPQPDVATELSNRWRRDVAAIYRMPCDAWYAHDRVEPCVFGKDTAPRTVVLLGDSIGVQWFSMIPEIFPEPDWRVVVLTKSACAMVDEEYFYEGIGQVYRVCTRWRNAVLDMLDRSRPDVVVTGSAATYGFSGASWVEGSARVLGRLSKAAGEVFVVPGTPSLGFDGPGCVSRHRSRDGHLDRSACRAADRARHVEPVTRSLRQAADRFPNVRVLDLNDLVCPDGTCNAVSEEGVVVFRDSQHLTDSFVRARIPLVRQRLDLLGRD